MAFLIALLCMVSNAGFAQQQTGRGAAAGKTNGSSDGFAWGIGLGGLAVLATVVGLTASSATSTPSTFSH